jgi:T5SS/PEP-CTERM-associated repeat protein
MQSEPGGKFLALVALALGLLANVSLAANQFWDSSVDAGYQHGDGVWSTADANWRANGTAAAAAWVNNNTALFSGSNGTSLISLNSTVGTAGLVFNNSGYTLAISGGGMVSNTTTEVMVSGTNNRIELTGGGSSATWRNTALLRIGQTNGYNAFVVNGDGVAGSASATNSGIHVGLLGSQGNLLMVTNGGVLFSGSTYASIGYQSSSNLAEVTDGGALWNPGNANLWVGYSTGSTGNVLRIDGQGVAGGARVTNVAAILVGNTSSGGQNELVITNGGQLYNTTATIGLNSSYNRATVSGTNTLWRLGGFLYIGDGTATGNLLTIGSGAVVTNATELRVGAATGSFLNRMVLTNGGSFFSSGSVAYIGVASPSNTVEVTGAASLWNLGNISLYVGNSGIGNALTIDQGGMVTNAANLFIGNGAGAIGNTLTIDRGGAVAGVGTLTVRPTNSLAFLGGMLSVSNLIVTNGVIQSIGDGTQTAELVIRGGTHTNNVGFLIQSNATVSGRGRLAGAASGVVFAAGSTLRPGVPGSAAATVATMQLGPSTWQGGAILDLNITNVTGTAGTDWDSLQILGGMNFVTNGGKLKIRLDSAGVTSGGFDPNISRIIPLITYSNSSIAQADIELDTTNFQIGSNWVVDVAAWAIQLRYQRTAPYLYVSTNGSNMGGGSWSTAYTNLQEAINNAQNLDTIYLAGGQSFGGGPLGAALPSNSVFLLQNRMNITLRGGYEANPALSAEDHPGTNNPASWPTVLRRESGSARVLAINAVTNALIESVIMTNGSANTAGSGGSGVFINGSRNVTLSKCDIAGNTIKMSGASGAGLYLVNGDATLVDSRLVGNTSTSSGSSGHVNGGGGYVASGGSLTILRSLVSANRSAAAGSGYNGKGGGLYLEAGSVLDIRESVISANTTSGTGNANYGGGVYSAGRLWMQNCLVVSNWSSCTPPHSDGIFFYSGTATVVNCTVADNNNGVGLRYNSGVVAVSNSILWGHSAADLQGFPTDGNGKLPDVWYSCSSNSPNAGFQFCVDNDPLFADRAHYHLQSTEGFYTNGYFSGGYWTNAAFNSDLIDLGHDQSDWSREPAPNGGRINMGAYGGTEVASKSADIAADPVTIINSGAQAWGHRTVTLRGEVTDTGGQTPTVWFLYWQTGGETTNLAAAGLQPSAFETSVSGLIPGADYQYVAVASNSAGAVQSGASGFSLHSTASALHVATNGSNTAGTNWSTAYRDIQTAFDVAEDGDTIYVAGHTFAGAGTQLTDFAFRWQNATGITLRGGYQAASDTPHPGPRDSMTWPTIIRRAAGGYPVRVLTISAVSNAVIEQVTIRDGLVDIAGAYGMGLLVNNCQSLTVDSCTITNNQIAGNGDQKGAGIFINNSSLLLTNCVIVKNTSGGSSNGKGYGGGIYLNSGALTMVLSRVTGNTASGIGQNPTVSDGGGLHVAGGSAVIRQSVLGGNASTRFGGGIYNAGMMRLENSIVHTNSSVNGDGIYIHTGGTGTLMNCTIANNVGEGIRAVGTVTITNSILWGNGDDLTGTVSVAFSDIGTADAFWTNEVNGCITNNPLFVDTTYYHLQSRNGHYVGGYFSGGTWDTSLNNSPCIDTGYPDPSDPWRGVEPEPNGKRSNMGAYGNTTVASKGAAPSGSIFMLR